MEDQAHQSSTTRHNSKCADYSQHLSFSIISLNLYKMKLSTSTLAFFAAQTAVAAPRPIDTSSALSKRFSINDLVAAILSVFPVNILVGGLEGTLTDALQGVADGLGIETTLNASATCADITILFARGTEEPGNVGVVVGPAFFQAVEEKVGGSVSVTVQGTNNCK